jgi:uncharacterized protein YbjT (DUF2867 family)
MSPPVLVTGGTGVLGGHVTPLLRRAGCELRVLSRRHHPPADGVEHVTADLRRRDGLAAVAAAAAGVETVLHLAGGPRGDDTATANLLRALSGTGVRHLVLVSVVGADRVPVGYLRAKLAAERAVADSGVPWTTLRSAQFHGLVLEVVHGLTRFPVVPLPTGLRFEPVHPAEVAARLVDLALGGPAGRVPDLVGPQVLGIDELVHGYLRATGARRWTVPLRVPGAAGRAYRAGDNLSPDGAEHGRRTWQDFLGQDVLGQDLPGRGE